MASFRTTVWDPNLIVGQIFALQSIFYLSECVLMILSSFVSTYNPAVEHLFALQTIRPRERRPLKKTTRELIGVNPRRMLMALRSDMHLESVWALTVMLYDDDINPVSLTSELLCLVMEHFCASLSLVFPKVFQLPEISSKNEFIPSSPEMNFWQETIENAKIEGEELKTAIKLPTPKTSVNKPVNLNEYSRGGIVVKDSQMPNRLKRWRPSSSKPKEPVETPGENPNAEERNRYGFPSEFATRLAQATKAQPIVCRTTIGWV